MGSLVISDKILKKYFAYLKNLDNDAKRSLITLLQKSMKTKSPDEINVEALFGAWEDERNSDEIIAEIKDSRVNKTNTASLE